MVGVSIQILLRLRSVEAIEWLYTLENQSWIDGWWILPEQKIPSVPDEEYFVKVNKDGTSQTCPKCGAHTGKKTLDVRFHHCDECGYTTTRDVAASQEVRNRGLKAVGQIVC